MRKRGSGDRKIHSNAKSRKDPNDGGGRSETFRPRLVPSVARPKEADGRRTIGDTDMTTARIDELHGILGDAQYKHRGLETDAVLEALMDGLGYDAARKRWVFDQEKEAFAVLLDEHGSGPVKAALRKAIERLVAEDDRPPIAIDLLAFSRIKDLFEGKEFAFVAVVAETAFSLGVAVADEPGYWPLPAHLVETRGWEEMNAAAAAINARLGLDEATASRIVSSSMAAQNKQARKTRKKT